MISTKIVITVFRKKIENVFFVHQQNSGDERCLQKAKN